MNPQERNEKPNEQKPPAERVHVDRDTQQDAATAPEQNRAPAEQHRGGPLPNQKR